MANTEQESKIKLEDLYKPSAAELDFIADVYQKYYKWRNNQNTSWKQFEGLTIKQYISEAREKFNGFLPINSLLDKKRPKFFSNEFRMSVEKVALYVANLVQNPKFSGVEGLDPALATFLNALLKYIRRGAYWKILDTYHFMQTIIDGTGIVFVSWTPKRRKLKNILEYDLTTGEIEFEEKEYIDDEITEVWVDPLDFFVPKIWEINIQEQKECIWRQIMTWSDFKRRYGHFPLSKYVYPGIRLAEQSIYSEFLDKALFTSDKIEVVQYFNSEEDEYGIIANGVLINPLSAKQRKSKISPLPWNHKSLPFAKTIYRLTSPALFWGVSLVMSAKDEVSAKNELIEMALDRITRATNPPVITTDTTVPNNLELESGKLYVSRGTWQELQMNPLDPNVWNMQMVIDNQLQKDVTPMTFPTPPTRQPRSASEVLAQQQRELGSFQLQKTFYQDLIEQKVWLEIQNALQFLTAERARKIVGEQTFEKTLYVENIQTPNGLSDVILRIKESEQISSSEDLAFQSVVASINKKRRIEIIEISINVLKNLKFDVEITFDTENTPAIRKAMFLEFIQTISQMFPQLLDQRKALVRLFEVWNENPADYLLDDIWQQIYLPGQQQIQQPQQLLGGEQPVQSMPEQLLQAGIRGPVSGVQGGRGQSQRQTAIPNLMDLLTLGEGNV